MTIAGGHRGSGLLFAALCLGLLLTLSDADFGWVTDGQIMLDTAVALREFGDIRTHYGFDTEGFTAVAGRSGKYGLGYSLLEQIPLALVAPVEAAFGPGSSNVLFPLMNLILTAATGVTIAVTVRALGGGAAAGAMVAAAYAFGTFAWPYVSYDFSEPLQALCVACAFLLTTRTAARLRAGEDPRWLAILAALSLGLGILTKATLLVLFPVFAIYVGVAATGHRRALRNLLGYGLTMAIALAGIALLNGARYGSWLDFGYGVEGKRFTTPLLTGLYGLLIGPNKGLVFYAPVALLAPWGLWRLTRGSRRSEALLLLDYPPLKLDLSPLTEGFVLARLRSARLWLWDRLLSAPRESIFQEPIYAAALTRLGDAARKVGDRERAFECHRRARRILALAAPAAPGRRDGRRGGRRGGPP